MVQAMLSRSWRKATGSLLWSKAHFSSRVRATSDASRYPAAAGAQPRVGEGLRCDLSLVLHALQSNSCVLRGYHRELNKPLLRAQHVSRL